MNSPVSINFPVRTAPGRASPGRAIARPRSAWLDRIRNSSRWVLLAGVVAVLGGCASPSVRTVPFKVQSDPLGGYVLYQVQADVEDVRTYDWVYLGVTPVDIRRAVDKVDLNRADAFVLRVIKEGYHDQHKSWTGEQLVKEAQSKGAVFWNPRLVPVN